MGERQRQGSVSARSTTAEAAEKSRARSFLESTVAGRPFAEQVQLLRPPLPLGIPAANTESPIQAAGLQSRNPLATLPDPGPSGAGRQLPADVQAKMEQSFGTDFSSVRVHEDAKADSIGALAYTRGRDIHFASGRYAPHSEAGQRLLGHELAHVVQQSKGRVTAPAASPVNADRALEAEAERQGVEAARGEQVAPDVQLSAEPPQLGFWEGLIAQFALGDSLKEAQLKALTDNSAIKTKLEALYGTGFALSSTSGRIVYRKAGSFADAKSEAGTHLGVSFGTNKLDGKGNNSHGVPKELYAASVDGCTVNVRNVSSENVPGTIEVHVGDFIFEFKYEK